MTIKTQIKEICTGEQNLKAKANLLLDDSFLVRDIRIVEGKSGLFISFPARRVDDKFVDICFPLNAALREEIKTLILDEYRRTVEKTQAKTDLPAAVPETPAEAISAEQEPADGGDEAAAEQETESGSGEEPEKEEAPDEAAPKRRGRKPKDAEPAEDTPDSAA